MLIAEAARVFDLTPAEAAILCLAAEGHTPGEIAKLRNVQPSTVKKQVQLVNRKLGARSLTHAAIVVLRMALVQACSVDPVRLAS